ncbi:MAG: hypothetical protein II937_13770 [Bacteroidales bacterium]|nr:hypothetical protein [Bacteroidales bacterium]
MDKYESEHNKTIERYAMLIKQLFGIALNEFAQVASIVEGDYSGNEMFNFDDYPQTMATVAKIVNTLANNMNVSVVNGCKAVWDISNMKNNALVESLFKGKDLTDEQKIRYFQNNEPALKAFTERKHNGLRLSDRVWNIVGGYKNDIETALSVSIEQGKSAHDLAKEVQQYLNKPDKLFRRVRDEFGELQLSKNAQNYHPGAGVYRSSYKNALRLARTEINMAYRTADFTRYQQFDFIVGIEIKTSGNHPEHDICDQLAGRYPKDFKFVGWHPNCRCYQTTILKTEDEMDKDEERMRRGQEPIANSKNTIKDVPDEFKKWVEDNEEKIKRAKNKPYFVTDNQKYMPKIKGDLLETEGNNLIQSLDERSISRGGLNKIHSTILNKDKPHTAIKQEYKNADELKETLLNIDKGNQEKWFPRGFTELNTYTNENGSTDLKGTISLSKERLQMCESAFSKIGRNLSSKISYDEADSLATLWHEIVHNRCKFGDLENVSVMHKPYIELITEFIARNTLPQFYKKLGVVNIPFPILTEERPLSGNDKMVRNFVYIISQLNLNKNSILASAKEYYFNGDITKQHTTAYRILCSNGLDKYKKSNGQSLSKTEIENLIDLCIFNSDKVEIDNYLKTIY